MAVSVLGKGPCYMGNLQEEAGGPREKVTGGNEGDRPLDPVRNKNSKNPYEQSLVRESQISLAGHSLAVRGIYFLLFIENVCAELSILGPDISQTLDYDQQLRSVTFSASGIRQVSRSNIANT